MGGLVFPELRGSIREACFARAPPAICGPGPVAEPANARQADRVGTRPTTRSLEASWTMNESEECTGLRPRPYTRAIESGDEDEPPGKSRRHPKWRDVPDHL